MTIETKQQFINIDKNDLIKLYASKLSLIDHHLYLYICQNATFKYRVFGIYRKETFQTLRNAFNELTAQNKDITALKRSLARLEAAKLLKVQSKAQGLIISLEPQKTLADTKAAIESDLRGFTLYPERIKELRETIGLDSAQAYATLEKQRNAEKQVGTQLNEDDYLKVFGD